jgi:predicted MPP superfamily phosphohydrolase
MTRGFLVFLAVALAILLGFQYFIYFSTTRLLGIGGRTGRRILAAALLFLLAGAVTSVFLQRRVDTVLARAVAGTFQLSLGLGLTLATAFLLAWALWGSARIWNPRLHRAPFGWSAIVLAVLFAAYGVWSATHPRVARVTVHMRDLPPEWRGKTIAQISDLHLGFSVGRSFAERVVEMVNAERPAAVVITGDLFDGDDAGLDGLADTLNGLNPPMGTYFITGNHETYVGVTRVEEALRRTKVRVLNDEMATPGGLQIIGISYPHGGEYKDLGAAIRNVRGFDPARASVLLYHSPVRIPEIKATGVRLQLSGHTHRGQLFPLQFITRRVYGKYDHGLNVEGDFAIYTSVGTGTWGPRMRTSARAEIAIIRLEPM